MDKKASVKRQASSVKQKENKTLRERMIEVAKMIKWLPDFGLERELDWLKNMHDWLISKKNRYWGLALPIYECSNCGHFEVVGGYEELKEKSVSGWQEFDGHSPHKPFIDEVKIRCSECDGEISRVDDVGNVWLDAGIVPFSTYINPKTGKLSYTTDKAYWQQWFPVDFITESFPGQFKNWFYSMIAMSTVLEGKNPYKTVLGFASVLGEDGRPMHKSWGNAIEFNEGADKMGVDVMRWIYASQSPYDNLLFGYKKADETRRRLHLKLWNVYNFFVTYANIDGWSQKSTLRKISGQEVQSHKSKVENILDVWILTRFNQLIQEVTEFLTKYNSFQASQAIELFVDDLSTWYVRRSRDRVGPTASIGDDKNMCHATLWQVLTGLSRVLAPFIPFISEDMYTNLTGEQSVHLANWPIKNEKLLVSSTQKEVIEKMELVRKICELGHAERKKLGIKVKQPLRKLSFVTNHSSIGNEYIQLIEDELNVKKIEIKSGDGGLSVTFDTSMTPELLEEGKARDLVRQIQKMRKEAGCGLSQQIRVYIPEWPTAHAAYIKKETLATELLTSDVPRIEPI